MKIYTMAEIEAMPYVDDRRSALTNRLDLKVGTGDEQATARHLLDSLKAPTCRTSKPAGHRSLWTGDVSSLGDILPRCPALSGFM